jgi:hypothetical protein
VRRKPLREIFVTAPKKDADPVTPALLFIHLVDDLARVVYVPELPPEPIDLGGRILGRVHVVERDQATRSDEGRIVLEVGTHPVVAVVTIEEEQVDRPFEPVE